MGPGLRTSTLVFRNSMWSKLDWTAIGAITGHTVWGGGVAEAFFSIGVVTNSIDV